jgi:hypothetical protein
MLQVWEAGAVGIKLSVHCAGRPFKGGLIFVRLAVLTANNKLKVDCVPLWLTENSRELLAASTHLCYDNCAVSHLETIIQQNICHATINAA